MKTSIPLLLTIAALTAPVMAQEHEHGQNSLPDWYDPSCCNQRDCKPVPDDEIEFYTLPGGGLAARHKPTGNIFNQNQFKQSQDERYHVCIYNGMSLCFYDRAGV